MDELNNLFTEAAKSGKADYLKACWKQDVEEQLDFLKDQKNGLEEGFKFFSSWLDEKLLQGDTSYKHIYN